MSSSWEGWGQPWHLEPEAGIGQDGNSDDELDYNSVDAVTAGDQLFVMLTTLKLQETWSATQTSLVAFWAMKAGAGGPIRDFALKPGMASGHYSRVFDRAVGGGPKDKDFYEVSLARQYRFDQSRCAVPLPTLPLHECLLEELLESPHLNEAFDEALLSGDLPAVFLEHETVRAAPPEMRVHPICLYVDAVAFDRQDSIVGVWGYFLLSKRRHLLSCVRKSEMCKCSCSGWCTMYPLLSSVAWSLRAMLAGVHPTRRHDGSEFGIGDEARAAVAGSPMGWKALTCLVKGDWAEMVHTFGLPQWNDTNAPCPMCHGSVEQLYGLDGFSPLSMPTPPKLHSDYVAACTQCEHHAVLNGDMLIRVRASLAYDNKSGGSRGRALLADFPTLGLIHRDRLEPTLDHQDVGDIDDVVMGPLPVTFWRRSSETIVRRSNPLFGPGTGATIEHLGCDWLHVLSLGVFRFWLGSLFWALVEDDAWHINVPLSNRLQSSVNQLNDELGQWYRAEESCGRVHTRVPRLKPSMLGPKLVPELTTYGAQTNGILVFAKTVLATRGAALGDRLRLFQRGTDSLVGILELIREHKTTMQPAQIQRFCNLAADHITVSKALEVQMKPKHHMMLEMAVRFSLVPIQLLL
jgi:hypothetical protein